MSQPSYSTPQQNKIVLPNLVAFFTIRLLVQWGNRCLGIFGYGTVRWHTVINLVSLGKHFAPIALLPRCALLRYQHPTLLGMFVVAGGTMEWGFAHVQVHLSVALSASLRSFPWHLCFHCSFWTEHFPRMSLPPRLSSSGASGLGYSLLSMENTQLYVQARCCVTSSKCGGVPGDLSQSTVGTSVRISGFGWRNAL